MDETVTSRLKHKDLLLLDKLIEMGLFSNRSEAVRNIVSERINELIEEQLITPLQKELNRKSQLSDEELFDEALAEASGIDMSCRSRDDWIYDWTIQMFKKRMGWLD